MKHQETIVLSLGGSLIAPQTGIDIQFLKNFQKFIRTEITAKNRRFFIICGGGSTARNYIDGATKIIGDSLADEDKDWLGIHSTRLNAHLIRTLFRDIAYPRIFKHYDQEYDIKDEPVVVCSGWKPGFSTDYCAVTVAHKYGAKTVVNLSNIDKVYDKDPRKFEDARPIDKMSWQEFEKLVGNKWVPGLNAPFDPIATQLAKKHNLNVIILNGQNITNLEKALDGHKFTGTVIAPLTLDASFYDREYYHGEKGVFAHGLVRFMVPVRAFYRAVVIKFLFNPRTVLDVGCGLGHTVAFMRRLGIEAYGLEISRYALNSALPSVKKYIKYGDTRKIPYPDNHFDVVVSSDVLQHIHPEDLPQALAETTRVSRLHQYHRIYTQENNWLHPAYCTDLSNVAVLDREQWDKLWRKQGLDIVRRQILPAATDTTYILRKPQRV